MVRVPACLHVIPSALTLLAARPYACSEAGVNRTITEQFLLDQASDIQLNIQVQLAESAGAGLHKGRP